MNRRNVSLTFVAFLVAAPFVAGAADDAPGIGSTAGPESPVGYDLATRRVSQFDAPAQPSTLRADDQSVDGSPGVATPAKVKQPRSVIGSDDRFWIDNTTAFPWRTACKIYADFSSGPGSEGSGVLVGPRHVLTAGHVVYDHEHGGWFTGITVVPALDDTYEPYGEAYATKAWSFTGWIQDADPDHDMALIVLDSDIGNSTGWLGMSAASDATLQGSIVNSAGYPGDKQAIYDADYLWGANGTVTALSANTITYSATMDTYGGQSGSGVWQYFPASQENYVVAVHAYGDSGIGANSGTRLNSSKFEWVKAWKDGYDSPTDLRVAAVVPSIGAAVDAGAAFTVDVTVFNDGHRPANSASLGVFLIDYQNRATPLGSTTISLAGLGASTTRFSPTIPRTALVGGARIEARVNESLAISESDYTDDALRSGAFQVAPPVDAMYLGVPVKRQLAASASARFRVSVTSPIAPLRLQSKVKGFLITARRPDGSTFVFGKRWTEPNPAVGTWEFTVSNTSARRSRKFSFAARQ